MGVDNEPYRHQSKISSSKKIDLYPSRISFGVGSFVVSESGQIQYRVLNSCRIWSPAGLNTPHPLQTIQCLCILYFDTGGGGDGRLNQREGWRYTNSQSWKENTNMTDCISSLKTLVNTSRKVPLLVNFILDETFCLVVDIVTLLSPWS